MPAISVIVPVYKVENYLHRCVDSILSQTFQDFELILVDDGSPDRCGEICEAYAAKDSRIHVIHQENGGLSAARNSGIDWAFLNSDSQYLAFADSDDWLAPEYLEMLYRAVRETGCQISACNFQSSAGESLPEVEHYTVAIIPSDMFYCGGEEERNTRVIAVCKLYQKELFQSLRFPVGKLHEDEFTSYQLVYAVETVAVVPAKLYAYFQNGEGIMLSAWNPRRLHALEAMEQQIRFAKERGLSRLWSHAAKKYIYNAAQQLPQAKEEYQKDLRSRLRWGLSQGRDSGIFPFGWDTLWAYELAYPLVPGVWWLVFRIKAHLGR